ncbi:Alpha-L-fucosidase [Crateriforma conspicua]|nr:Alpha-L-fucosidase [Crateriforma conspicua]
MRIKSKPEMRNSTFACLCLFVVASLLALTPAVAESPSSDRDQRMAWWREAKFGMFVHWGIYSVTGGRYRGEELPNSAEWMMNRGKIPIAEYEQYAARFNPTEFDASKFVGLAKEAGMKYLIITAKHHDGFAMFDSHVNPFNVVDATPFGRDIMKELAEECQRQDIRFGFYYSQAQDWHHPGGFGNNWDKNLQRVSSDIYVREKAVPEVRQLLTEYGPIGIFWWDTPRKMSRESFDSLHSLTRLQPKVVTNDRLGEDYPGDYKTFERHIPDTPPADQDWEVCMPISGSWGYKAIDQDFKSSETLIRNLIDIASKGGNYLLNVSPTGRGDLLPQAVERLKRIGQWMKVNRQSIEGTQASPLSDLAWGRCTMKTTGETTHLFLHVFDWPDDLALTVPELKNTVREARLLADGRTIMAENTDKGVSVSLPMEAPDDIASVIVLEVEGELKIEKRLPHPDENGRLTLNARDAYIHNNEGARQAGIRYHDDIAHIGYWHDRQAWLEWNVELDHPATFRVRAELSVEQPETRFIVTAPGESLHATASSTGGYGNYAEVDLGTMTVSDSGKIRITLRPDVDHWHPMNLRRVELTEVKQP